MFGILKSKGMITRKQMGLMIKKMEYNLERARWCVEQSKIDSEFRFSHLNYAQYYLDEAERFFKFIFQE